MKDALYYIIASIVNNPKQVEILEKEEDSMIQFTIVLAKEDMGKVIGKQGKIIRAIRNVLKIPAMKQKKKISINLQEA